MEEGKIGRRRRDVFGDVEFLAVLIFRVVRQKIEVQGKEVLSVFSGVHS